MRTSPADLRIELGFLRDNLVQAVREEKASLVKEGLLIYEELVSAFIRRMTRWGSYDKKRAMQELSSIGGDWSEVQWVTDGFRELIDASLKRENRLLLKDVVYFPVRLASIAFSQRDYYIFYRFINWLPYVYEASLRIRDDQVKDFVTDRCWRYPKETADLIIVPDLKRCDSEQDADRVKDFAVGIVIIFNQLLLKALANKKPKDFAHFGRALSTTFEYFQVDGLGAEPLVSVRQELVQAKALSFYGLMGWVLYQYDAGSLKAEEAADWYGRVPCSPDLQENWHLLELTENADIRSDYGWDFWGFDGSAEDSISWGSGFDFHLPFVIKSLDALGRLTQEQCDRLTLVPSSGYTALPGKEGYLLQILDGIEQEREKWQPILGEMGIAAAPRFREVLSRSVSAQKAEKARWLIAEEVSNDRVVELIENIRRAWTGSATLRAIIKKHGKYEAVGTAPSGIPHFGINVRDKKEFYIEESDFLMSQLGKQYGDVIARGEDKTVLEAILGSAAKSRDLPTASEEVLAVIDETLIGLHQLGYRPGVILAVNTWRAVQSLEGSGELMRTMGAAQNKPLLGYFRGLAVYRLFVQGPSAIAILDLNRFGKWTQFQPTIYAPGGRAIGNTLALMLRPITREQALALIDKNPGLRRDQSGREMPLEDALLELQQDVHLSLTEQFEYETDDGEAGVILRSSEPS